MGLIIGIIIYIILTIGILPYANSYSYVKYSVVPHFILAILTVYVNTKLGFNGLIENILFLALFHYSSQGSLNSLEKDKDSGMDDIFGHMIVRKANNLFVIVYFIVYLLLNVKLK